MEKTEAEREFARSRSGVYDLLSMIFDGDVDALMAAVEANAFDELASVLPQEFDTERLSREDFDPEALRIGYDNLFEVPGPYYVPPFASAHADEPSESFESDSRYHDEGTAGELLGDPAETMADLYGRVGFTPDRGGIPDHLAAEFEFMAVLAAGEETETGHETDLRAVQEDVLAHLEWIHPFAEAVERTDSAEGLYAAVCSIASAFVAWDARRATGQGD